MSSHVSARARLRAALHRLSGPALEAPAAEQLTVDDGEHRYIFGCDTPMARWRAETALDKEVGTNEWIRSTVRPGDVFYDIGANVGVYTLMAAKRVGDKGHVYAFEPHVANTHLLLENIRRNDLVRRCTAISAALSSGDGFFPFHYMDLAGGSAMSQLDETQDDTGKEFVPQITELKYAAAVDSLVRDSLIRPADLVKIDVDGNEVDILRGMNDLLRSEHRPRSIQTEINGRNADEVVVFMAANGYQLVARHYTALGKQQLETVEDPTSVGHNAIFEPA